MSPYHLRRRAILPGTRPMQILFRFIIGGLVVSLFAAFADALKPKSFAGLFAAAPSVAIGTLGLTILSEGKLFAATEARSMIFGALALFFYSMAAIAADDEVQAERCSRSVLSHCGMDDLRDGSLVRVVAMTANESSTSTFRL